MKRLLLAVLLAVSCNQGHQYPQKIQPIYTDPLPNEEQVVEKCTQNNDCSVGFLCKVQTGQCVECFNEDHCSLNFICVDNICTPNAPGDQVAPGDPFRPSDTDIPPGDPGEQPGDPNEPVNECYLGTCTEFSGYYLCLGEDNTIPDGSPECDPYTFEGCPPITTPFWVEFVDGGAACICLQECQWTP